MGEEEYLIPVNVSGKFEIIDGFGMFEIGITACVVAVGAVLMFLIRNVLNVPIHYAALFFIMVPGFFSFFILRRSGTSPSIFSVIVSIMNFLRKQKCYLFKLQKY